MKVRIFGVACLRVQLEVGYRKVFEFGLEIIRRGGVLLNEFVSAVIRVLRISILKIFVSIFF